MEGGDNATLTKPNSLHILTFLLIITLLFISNLQLISASTPITFIKTSCSTTTYPALCYQTLSPYASSIKTNPQNLCSAALTATIKAAGNTSSTVSKLAKQKDITRFEAAAIKDCIENIKDSIYELKLSLKAMGKLVGGNKEIEMGNIKTWVSAAITDENTCMDGFSGRKVDPDLRNTIRSSILDVARLSSNALSLINHLSAKTNN